MTFAGTIKELKGILSKIFASENWREIQKGIWQCRSSDGVFINWNSSSGAIFFQGKIQVM